jgi:hypothetical protein
MVKMSARNKGADPVEPQRREDVLRRGRRGVFSEEDTTDDAHTVAGDAIKWYRLVLFVDLDKLFGRTCISVFHAISAASLPARGRLPLCAYPDCPMPAHPQTRSLVNTSLELLAPKDRRRTVDQRSSLGTCSRAFVTVHLR